MLSRLKPYTTYSCVQTIQWNIYYTKSNIQMKTKDHFYILTYIPTYIKLRKTGALKHLIKELKEYVQI